MTIVTQLSDADRIALATEFEVSLNTVERWTTGISAPAPAIAARVDRWCIVRLASDDGPRLHIPADLLTRPAGGGVR
jgi:hypothetical protein